MDMKKIFQYGFAALAGLVLASCNGDYEDWKSPQGYGQESAAEKYGVTISAGADANITMPVDNDDIKLVSLSASSEDVTGFAMKSLTVNGEEISGTINDGNIIVSASKLNSIIEKQFNSRASVKRDITVESQVSLILKNGDAVTADVVGSTAAALTPKATPAIDPNGYYILGSFVENGWDLSKPIWMTNEGDGVYSAVVTLQGDGGHWYKFYEGSHWDASDWDIANQGQMGSAVDGDPALEGFVVYTGDTEFPNAPRVDGDDGSLYKITLDMKNLTYKLVRQAVNYYIIGGPNDWGESAKNRLLKFAQANIDVPVYTVIFPAAAEGDTWFAIGDDKACDAIANDNNWKLLYGTTSGNGNQGTSGTLARRTELSDDGSFKIEAGTAKFIKVTLDMSAMTYEVSPIDFDPYLYFIGATDGWQKAEQRLALTDVNGIYTGYIYCADPNNWGNEFKFQKVAGDWGTEVNTGHMFNGITGDAEDGGGNFRVTAGEGVYYFTLDMANGTFNAVRITNMNLVGDFNGWNQADDAQQMTWDAENYCFVIEGAGVTANGWKFTTNNAWDINLGGTIDNLWANGDNLTVEGTTIKLYPTRKDNDNIYCTVE